MTKSELASSIATKCGMSTAQAAKAVDTIVCEIKEAVKAGEEVTIRGFGAFKSVHKAEKQARNIATGEAIMVAAHNEPVFKPSKEFRQYVR